MATTKTYGQGAWGYDAYSDSSESGKMSSVATSSEDQPPRNYNNRNNRGMASQPRRPRDPEPATRPGQSNLGLKSSSKGDPVGQEKENRNSGFGISSDESSSGYNTDDSMEEEDRPIRRGGTGRAPSLGFGAPRRNQMQKEGGGDMSNKSDDDDSSMDSPPQKTPTKLNPYVKQSPRDGPADVENQKNNDGKVDDDAFVRDLNAIRRASTVTLDKEAARAASNRKAPSSDTNSDDSSDNSSDDDKPIPERRRLLTRERKIITCLTLFLGCFCLLAALGIGIAIGLASRRSEDSVPIVQAPSPVAPTPPPANVNPTPTPQPSDSQPLDEALLQLLIDSSFDDGASLLTQDTPQRNAYEWLSRNRELPNYSTEVKLSRYALATFYYSTNGPSTWDENIRNGWMTDAPECEWASTARNQCTGSIYSSLTLDFVGVSGQIPPEIAYLTGLTRLSLRSEGNGEPSVAGSLPSTIGQLVNLQTIRLNENNIGGTIPPSIGRLTNLRVFLMSGNSLEGSIPSEIGRTMGNTFNFDRNRLTGRLPAELFRMGTLTALNFEENSISGQIPRDIGSNPSLNSINFARNRLTGTIPTEFGRLVTVRSGINLSNNELSGWLPTELGFLVDMQNLLVNNNRLIGTVPRQYSSIRDMRLLRLDGNMLTGFMPGDVCDSFTERSISYSDCGTLGFQCSCCTFCCSGQLCACNVNDESICTEAIQYLDSSEVRQETSGLYYSESEENKGTIIRDSS